MNFATLFQTLEALQLSTAIRENSWLFPLLESIHVIAISLVFGIIALVDLRLLGVALLERTVTRLMSQLLPLAWTAFAVALLTGSTLFASNATAYAHNLFFRMKLVLIVAAGINMLVFHVFGCQNMQAWDAAPRTPWRARTAALISLSIWLSVVACGRWIGFTMI